MENNIYIAAVVVVLVLVVFGIAYFSMSSDPDPEPEPEEQELMAGGTLAKEPFNSNNGGWSSVSDHPPHIQADIDEVKGKIAMLKQEDKKKQEAVLESTSAAATIAPHAAPVATAPAAANVYSQTTDFLKKNLGIANVTTEAQDTRKRRQQSRTRVTQALAYVGSNSGKEKMTAPKWFSEMTSGPVRPPQKVDMARIKEAAYRNGIHSEEQYSMSDEMREEMISTPALSVGYN